MTIEDLLNMPRLSLTQARELTSAIGYTQVKSSAGWIPLSNWRPYGGVPEERLTFVLIPDEDVLVDRPAENDRITRAGFALGCWPLRTESRS